MKPKWILPALIVLALVASGSWVARAAEKEEENEKETSLDKIPAAAKAAIEKEAGDNKITKVLEGKGKDDKTYYEGQFTKDGKKMEVKVDADGKVLKSGAADEDEDKEKDKDKK